VWSFSRGGFDLDLFCHFSTNETPKMRLPSLFTLDLFCYDTVANQNKGAALGESAAVALEGLARNQPDQANDVISNLSDLQKHPALAKQIEKAKAEQEAIRATQGADQGQRIDPISTLPLALAEKLSSRFANEEDRAKFLEKVQARLSDTPQPEIKIREAVATSKEPKAQAEDMER
jgi:hypothetical protein